MRAALKAADSAPGYNSKNKTGAVIVEKNRIIAVGVNSTKTHPLAKTYSKHPQAIYLHAEIHAIIQAQRTSSNFSNCSIYIARRTYTTKRIESGCGLAKPCDGCAAAIGHFNFSLVGHSLDSDELMNYVTVDIRRNRVEIHMEICK